MSSNPEVVRIGLLDLQVCVPKEFSDADVEAFANAESPTGISSNWSIVGEGDVRRVQCVERPECCHLVLMC